MLTPEEIHLSIKKEILKHYPGDDSIETGWQQCIKDAMISIPWCPYKDSRADSDPGSDGNDTGQGVSEDVYWEDNRIMIADPDHPNSFCCGATMEAYIKALNQCGEYADNITEGKLRELVKWAFVYSKDKISGIGGGLVNLGLGDKVDIDDARFGDLVQMEKYYFNDDWDDGHSQIILSRGERKGKPVFWTWSSSKAIIRQINGTDVKVHGHVVDWFWIYKERNSMARKWHIARPKEY